MLIDLFIDSMPEESKKGSLDEDAFDLPDDALDFAKNDIDNLN